MTYQKVQFTNILYNQFSNLIIIIQLTRKLQSFDSRIHVYHSKAMNNQVSNYMFYNAMSLNISV